MTVIADRPTISSPTPTAFDHPPPADSGAHSTRSGLTTRWGGERAVFVLVSLVVYLTVAILLDFVYDIFPLDAVSRMANGFYVLYSRDPHLAAVGFVWNPLQSFVDVPLLLFKDLWPALASHDFAASLVTVTAGAAGVHQVHAALTEFGLRRKARLLLTAAFALNPMIVFYAGNGMSEALYVFSLVATCRYLMRWSRRDDMRSLVYAAFAISVAYLDRDEAIASAVLGALFVFAVTFGRAPGTHRSRMLAALTDLTVFALPVATAFVGWAVASYVVTGQAFEQFTSQYGNSAQLNAGLPHYTLMRRAIFDGASIEFMAPLLPIVVVVAVQVGIKRHDFTVGAPVGIIGGGLAFDAFGILANGLEPWYRFFILVAPLNVLLIGYVLSPGSRFAPARRETARHRRGQRHSGRLSIPLAAGCFALVAIVPSIPSAGIGMFSSKVHSSEATELGGLLLAHPNKTERQFVGHYRHIESIDSYLDRLDLAGGAIVADTAGNCTPQIVTSVANPRMFVITSDRDFQEVLADPLTFHATYLLDPEPAGVDVDDALNVEYPNLFQTGDGFARLVHQFPSDGTCADYRLYKVIGHPA